MRDGVFDGFGNRAAKAAAGAGELFEDLAADVRRVGRRCDDARTVSAHDFAAERLLLVAHFDHIDDEIEVEIGACHGKRRSPLACAGFGRDALEALFFGVISLRDGGVELV